MYKLNIIQVLAPPTMREKEDILVAVRNFGSVLSEFVPSVRRERDPSGKLRADIKALLSSPTRLGLKIKLGSELGLEED
jgi:hypothetical protein